MLEGAGSNIVASAPGLSMGSEASTAHASMRL
jgi:hypothetical protein